MSNTVALTPSHANDKAQFGTVDSSCPCISGDRKTESKEDHTLPSSSSKIIDKTACPSHNSNDSEGACL